LLLELRKVTDDRKKAENFMKIHDDHDLQGN